MFGNRLGWGISTFILVLAGYFAFLIWQAGKITAPTGWVAATVRPIQPPKGADAVTPPPLDSRDAGPLYQSAIDDYRANTDAYSTLNSAKTLETNAVNARPGLQSLVQASHCSTMHLFRDSSSELTSYEPDKTSLDDLGAIASAAAHVGTLAARHNDVQLAGEYYAAIYQLGFKLFQERISFAELTHGEELMGLGCAGLGRLAQRQNLTPIADQLAATDNIRLAQFEADIKPVWQIIGSVDEPTMAAHAGDIFQIINDRSIEHTWRVEAALHLGRLKYNAGRRADQIAARIVLTKVADDSSEDPTVRSAAAAARDLTLEQYRALR